MSTYKHILCVGISKLLCKKSNIKFDYKLKKNKKSYVLMILFKSSLYLIISTYELRALS